MADVKLDFPLKKNPLSLCRSVCLSVNVDIVIRERRVVEMTNFFSDFSEDLQTKVILQR
jgi:hypothetical protein